METAVLSVQTGKRTDLQPITNRLYDLIRQYGWLNGILTVFVPHTTAAVTINENADPDVVRDITWFMERLVPNLGDFRHAEGNSDAHIKASLFGSSVQIPVKSGRLWLGSWQAVYFCEFDGPRNRTVHVAFVGS